ncbi:RNA-dependent RNA polymerase, partial [Phenoliferia sp. Uapishka_3]
MLTPRVAANRVTAFTDFHLSILRKHQWSFLHIYCLGLFFAPQGTEELADLSPHQFAALLCSIEIDEVPSLERLNSVFQGRGHDPLPFAPSFLEFVKKFGESKDDVQRLFLEGSLTFRASFDIKPKSEKGKPAGMYIQLGLPTISKSCRFTRGDSGYGSHCFFRIKISKSATTRINDEAIRPHVEHFISKPIEIAGNTYWGYWFQEEKSQKTIYYFTPDLSPLNDLADFVNAHTDLSLKRNRSLTFAKFCSRFSLGHSSSTPTISFQRKDVLVIPDLEYDTLNISYGLLKHISEAGKLDWMPSCIEGEVHGRRETFALQYESWPSSSESDPEKWIELYAPSTTALSSCRNTANITFRVVGLDGRTFRKISLTIHPDSDVEIRWKSRDIHLEERDPDRKNCVMSDGCGQISLDAMKEVREILGEFATPMSCQFRLKGTKGMVTTPPRQDNRPGIWIEVRQSQVKTWDKVNTTFELEILRVPKAEGSGSSKIGKQPIEVLSNGGVPNDVFQELLQKQVEPLVKDLIDTFREASFSPIIALDTVFSSNGMLSERHSRITRNINPQSLSLSQTISLEEEEFGNPLEYLDGTTDPYSGAPNTLPEFVTSCLMAGVNPREDPVIASKFRLLGKLALDHILLSGQLCVEKSVHFRVTVDVAGILKPNEISVRFSETRVDDQGIRYQAVNGEVLVFRSPCMAASDVQKVVAVDHPAFAHRLDEIVFSRHGHRALCSLLSGGDYDGDSVTVIWDKALVDSFKNASEVWADPPFEDHQHLKVDGRKVAEVLEVAPSGEIKLSQSELSRQLLAGVYNPTRFGISKSLLSLNLSRGVQGLRWRVQLMFGGRGESQSAKKSRWFDDFTPSGLPTNTAWSTQRRISRATYSVVYWMVKSRQECSRSEQDFCLIIFSEQGLSISDGSFKTLSAELSKCIPHPQWVDLFGPSEERRNPEGVRRLRNGTLHPADALLDSHKTSVQAFLTAAHEILRGVTFTLDADFLAPWLDELKEAAGGGSVEVASLKHDLKAIYKHVERAEQMHRLARKRPDLNFGRQEKRLDFKSKLRPVSEALWTLENLIPKLQTAILAQDSQRFYLRRLIASCVYSFRRHPQPEFLAPLFKAFRIECTFEEAGKHQDWLWSWDVAHSELCAIKAEARKEAAVGRLVGAEAARGSRPQAVMDQVLYGLKPDQAVVKGERKRIASSTLSSPAKVPRLG